MALNAGIVGLPNVGKSTLFNALTQAGARVENFPFCTIEPNHGIVAVPDARLDRLRELLTPPKVVPASLELVDIAGLVEGAHHGEGLGNQFLGQIRSVDAVVHVLRCFEGEVAHVSGTVDPVRDLEVVRTELALADLETVERRLEKVRREAGFGMKDARRQLPVLEQLAATLGDGIPLRQVELSADARAICREFGLITAKPILYVANVDEAGLKADDAILKALKERLAAEGAEPVKLYAEMEMEIAALDDPDERALFLDDLGLSAPGLELLAQRAYALLGLISFYTFVGGKELRAWPIPAGTTAPKAAGTIHTDFERGFIRGEVASFDDFIAYGGESGVRDKGLLRSEGKDYVVRDGDVIHFRFNV